MLPNEKLVNIEEFFRLRENIECLMEYIDGVVYSHLPHL